MRSSSAQREALRESGFVCLRGFLLGPELHALSAQIDALMDAPDRPAFVWKFCDEEAMARGEHILSRIERFVPYHPELRALLCEGPLRNLASELLGEPALLFKDKINLKLPGSGGFLPHQDAQAGWLAYGPRHLTIMISIDATTRDNGCLEISRGRRRTALCGEEWHPLSQDAVPEQSWEPVETLPGDIVAFDSYVVHRSAPNQTDRARRVIYATYNPKSQGDCYERYFADKHKNYPPDIERKSGQTYRYRV